MAKKDNFDEKKQRQERLLAIKKAKINPYPNYFEKKFSLAEAKGKKEGTAVKTAGRLMSWRVMGKIAFGHLQDMSGRLQIVLSAKEVGADNFKFFSRHFDLGDFIGVEGKIFITQRGEISVLVKKYQILSKALSPLPEKWHGLKDKELRYRQRYLDLLINPEVREVFQKRAKIIDLVRAFLKDREFVEVETPNLQIIYGGASARPFVTHLNALDLKLYLSISPELYLKRLVVGGLEKVFTIGKNFRNEGIDKFHNPEFTMMEFYWAYANYENLMTLTEELINWLIKELKLPANLEYQGKKINLKTPIKRVKFNDLIKEKTGLDLDQASDFDSLKKAIKDKKIKEINLKGKLHYGSLVDELYKRLVRPSIIQPIFLTHYPAEMIALAKKNEENPRVINTFQLIIDGAEVVKAYDELNDPLEQESRLIEQAKLLKKGDAEAMPMDEDFINALKIGLPPTAGYGLGVDRLIMLLTNQPSIRDVILFPFMRPEDKK